MGIHPSQNLQLADIAEVINFGRTDYSRSTIEAGTLSSP